MSDMMRIEFVGGPLDGETMALPVTTREWRVAMKDAPDEWKMTADEYIPAMLGALCSFGIYAPVAKPTEFHWRGMPEKPRDVLKRDEAERREYERLKKKFDPSTPPTSSL